MKTPQNPPNEKPISLHPLTLEEALRKAIGSGPPKDKPKPKGRAKDSPAESD